MPWYARVLLYLKGCFDAFSEHDFSHFFCEIKEPVVQMNACKSVTL